MNTALVWFRNNLRTQDNIVLAEAVRQYDRVIPLYVFDPFWFGDTDFGFEKTGPFRAKFLVESIQNLKHNLQQLSGDLAVRQGKTEDVIAEYVQAHDVQAIFYPFEAASEEQSIESAVRQAVPKQVQVFVYQESTLVHRDHLPFDVRETPEQFTVFRKKVEKDLQVRSLEPVPEQVPIPTDLKLGQVPTLEKLGIDEPAVDERAAIRFEGGETAGLRRLKHYLWDEDLLKSYKETRNGLLGADYSGKFSAWMANGCLSPRTIYWEVKRYEAERVSNDSTYWMIFEILWRDYWKWLSERYGDRLFYPSGPKGKTLLGKNDLSLFNRWKEGRTGVPFVDANMIELQQTGFMSNRGRQNVASFLVKDLGINWLLGAEYFESMLIDYDPASNYGNWAYVAGVGNDPRKDRYFNVVKQSKDYDPEGLYSKHWLPQLEKVSAKAIHSMGNFDQALYEETDYTYPIQLPLAFRQAHGAAKRR